MQSDAAALEAFLVQHRDSSMFLRSNARRGGLDFKGQHAQAQYVAAFRGELQGVLEEQTAAWTGMILVQAPEQLEALATACIAQSSRGYRLFRAARASEPRPRRVGLGRSGHAD